MNQFATICLDVYFTENYSEMDFIIVNAGLHSMFKDYSTIVIGDERERCERHSLLCCANLETALSNLPLHMPAVPKAIIALLFGAFHAIELSKPFLAWTLSSKASEICQTLGYHRESSLNNGRNEDDRLRKFLFWSNYFIDKSLSLRLGRASTIPEWTITVTRPSIMDSHPEPALAYFVLWVEAARCQGKIYELLYSPDSVRQRDEERRSRVQSLISDLENLDKATSETNASNEDTIQRQRTNSDCRKNG
ncbi:fungal specific transcription factor domain-containing protein [Colletotrichum scovillei]|nr:fungal specific transcription factor domain-containing protein [Colletotrichum scovillei]